MAFDLNNYNIESGSETASLANHVNNVVEALSDGIDFKDDSGPVFMGLAAVAAILQGRDKLEIRAMLLKAAAANVFDELAEASTAPSPDFPA